MKLCDVRGELDSVLDEHSNNIMCYFCMVVVVVEEIEEGCSEQT